MHSSHNIRQKHFDLHLLNVGYIYYAVYPPAKCLSGVLPLFSDFLITRGRPKKIKHNPFEKITARQPIAISKFGCDS